MEAIREVLMVDRQEFIEREILPALGEYAGDYDVEGIVDAVSEFDGRRGYFVPHTIDSELFWELVEKNAK